MTRLYLVRHAKPAAAWGEDPDPGLDDLGRKQASAAAATLAGSIAQVRIYSSPLRRCRDTAAALAERWGGSVEILTAVAEIPSPPLDAEARRAWLARGLQGTWRQLHEGAPSGSTNYLAWRRSVVDALLAMPHDCVIYTHYIAINVAVGAATADERVLCFRPDHASITILDAVDGALRVQTLGAEAETQVLTGR